MKLDEMKVQYERSRDGFTHESKFTLKQEKQIPKIDINGIAVKIGLCVGVLALAFIVRAFGVGAPKEKVAEVSSRSDGSGETEQYQPGKLRYVEANGTKWASPVRANDIELMREESMLRFTAGASGVSACMDGKVLSVGTDPKYGTFVRVQSPEDCETVCFGLESVSVKEGDSVKAGDMLGTVSVGRSMYLKVYEKGEPQDPTAYVDLSLKKE